MPMLQEILHRNQITLTDEEKRVKAMRKLSAAVKSKATRERNKEKLIADHVSAALSTLASAVPTPAVITSMDSHVNVTPVPQATAVPSASRSKSKVTKATVVAPPTVFNTSTSVIRNRADSTTEVSNPKIASSTTTKSIDYETFLSGVDHTTYTWLYITLNDTRSFEGLLTI